MCCAEWRGAAGFAGVAAESIHEKCGKEVEVGYELPESSLPLRTRRRDTRQRITTVPAESVTWLARDCTPVTRFPTYMSCLSRIGCLTVVVLAGAGAWWMYGGEVPSFMGGAGRVRLGAPDTVDAAGKPVAWSGIKDAQVPGAHALSELERPNGPAYITLGAGDLAGFLAEGFGRALPQSAQGVQVAIVDDRVRMRAEIPLRELGGSALPEFVSNLLTDRDTVDMTGVIEMIRPGLAQFRVRSLSVHGIDVPTKLIPPLLKAVGRQMPQRDLVATDAFALPLPRAVADVRVSRGRVTLYKSAPSTSK